MHFATNGCFDGDFDYNSNDCTRRHSFERVGTCCACVLPGHVWHSILDLRFFVVLLVEIHRHTYTHTDLITPISFACFHFILYYSSFNIGNYFYNILSACALCVRVSCVRVHGFCLCHRHHHHHQKSKNNKSEY